MRQRNIGTAGLSVGEIGLGCMGMSQSYGPADPQRCVATIHAALDAGVSLLDTADVYGFGANERLVGQAVAGRRDEVVIATKFGVVATAADGVLGVSGRPEYVVERCEASLERLGMDHIDLYYQHRVDPDVPIEETVGAMAGLVQAGKVRYLGLSEASAASLERACAVHQISALQSEWSIWARELEEEVLGVARRLGVGLVPYSPLGRGFLTGQITSTEGFTADDTRLPHPRFQGENLRKNLELVRELERLAAERSATAAAVALAWLLAQGDDVVPIPGTTRPERIAENLGAADVQLDHEDLRKIEDLMPAHVWAGDRHGRRPRDVVGYGESRPLATGDEAER